MSAEHHSGKGYTPLPQCMSNTDTEDEDEHVTQRNDLTNKQTNDERETTEPTTVHEHEAYYPLDETRNLANRTRNGQNIIKCYRDDIPKMIIEGNTQNDLWKRRDMSPLRRFCLVISILLCIVTILVFLYVLPCDTMICPPVNESQSSVSWEKTLWNVEVHGPITIIPGSPYDLIFLLRGQEYNDSNTDNSSKTSRGSSIVSIHGTSGLYLWLVCLERVPTNIDCISIDTDRSGKTDCIVVGERGLLKSIDPTTGIIHWNSEVHTFPKLPVILPDLNSDGIEDLLSVELTQGNISSLVLLSGNTGQLLGKYIKHNCSLVNIYNLVSDGTILYLCHDMNGKRITKYVSLKALLNGSSLSQRKREITASPRIFKTMMLDEQNNYWKPTRYHRLMVENEGICSWESCKATLNLTLQKEPNQTLKIWEYVSPNSFVSKPVFLITSEEPYSTGFVIKFWQWLDTNPSVTDAIPSNVDMKCSRIVTCHILSQSKFIFQLILTYYYAYQPSTRIYDNLHRRKHLFFKILYSFPQYNNVSNEILYVCTSTNNNVVNILFFNGLYVEISLSFIPTSFEKKSVYCTTDCNTCANKAHISCDQIL